MHRFNENHPELIGFSEYYAETIFPKLEREESVRLSKMQTIKKLWICLGIVGLLAVGSAIYMKVEIIKLVMIGAIFILLGYIIPFYIFRDVKSDTKNILMSSICRFLGWEYSEDGGAFAPFVQFTKLGLLSNRFDRVSFEDWVTAIAHGTAFEFCETHMETHHKTKNGDSWRTIFRGQLLVLNLDRKFLGETIVLRDKGMFNSERKGVLKRVGLVDPIFEKIFEVYSTDQVEARYLLTPTFMQKLVDLEQSVDGKKIRFAFSGGKLLIAVETENRFEAGSMFDPLTSAERTQKTLDEIGAIYDVIDGVVTQKRPS